jgi:hypothetical protein
VRLARPGDAPAGVVVEAPGLLLGHDMDGVRAELLELASSAAQQGFYETAQALRVQWTELQAARDDIVLVAVAGRVTVSLEPSGAALRVGEVLGLATSPGRASRHLGGGPALGLALSDWNGGAGSVEMLLQIQQATAAGQAPASAAEDVVHGLRTFHAGASTVVVQDGALTAGHLPIVTFYGDPGSRFWIAERGAGYFVLQLATPPAAAVEFGFEARPGS